MTPADWLAFTLAMCALAMCALATVAGYAASRWYKATHAAAARHERSADTARTFWSNMRKAKRR